MKRLCRFPFFISVVIFALASCSKPDIADQNEDIPDVETPDTTEKIDSTKPEEPIVPEETFFMQASFSAGNLPKDGWKDSWHEGDAMNLFSIAGTNPEPDEKMWTNHGKFVYDPATDNSFTGEPVGDFVTEQKYLWHAVYPYSKDFIDPSGIDVPFGPEEQVLLIGHLPGECVIQKGYGSTAHLAGPHMPLYGAARTVGKERPQFRLHQMAAVINLKVTNSTSAPMTVDQIKIEYSDDYLVGRFAIDFSRVTAVGSGCLTLEREDVEASDVAVLKIEDAGEIPIGETVDFYVPIIPVRLWRDSQLIVTVDDYVEIIEITSNMDVYSGRMKTFDISVTDPQMIELVSPAADAALDLSSLDKVEFKWNKSGDNELYSILFSATEDMTDYQKIDVTGTSMWLKAEYFDNFVFPFGIESGESGKIYWSVVIRDDNRPTKANSLTVQRLNAAPYEDRIAESITIPVAVLIEDPVYNGRMEEYCGKRITEIVHKGWGYKWNDPYVQMREYERDMEASSHGVVQYEVVRIVEADQLFSYHKNSADADEYHYLTADTLVNYYFHYRPTTGDNNIDHAASYDYVGMMEHYGFDKMVDNGEIKEVWVYTHPTSGMYESRLIGDGAFWCNSPGIGAGQATNSKLCCVMFCNYERTTDLAMHSFGHRFESIMSQVYANRGGYSSTAWKYDDKSATEELTNWEKYSAHNMEFDKFKKGYAHIGMCHFPPNAQFDYDYGNSRYVTTYADTWFDYPDIREDDSVARRVDKSEWNDAGGDQWGYMKWYFGHIPHFKGLCPRDGHLNNWWYYLVDYSNAMIYEEQLKSENYNLGQ